MKKYVSTTYTGCNYITAGKLYEVAYWTNVSIVIERDDGKNEFFYLSKSLTLKGHSWTVHEVGTLAEIGAKVGDVVGNANVPAYRCKLESHMMGPGNLLARQDYYIITRATDDTQSDEGTGIALTESQIEKLRYSLSKELGVSSDLIHNTLNKVSGIAPDCLESMSHDDTPKTWGDMTDVEA